MPDRTAPVPAFVPDHFADRALARTLDSVRQGDWRAAAALLGTPADLDRRAHRVTLLAGADPAWAEDWLRARPDDPSALAVRAHAQVRHAWRARGSGWSESVGDAAFAEFFRRLDVADEFCRSAIVADPEDLAPWVTWLTVARGQELDHAEFTRRWARTTAVHPGTRAGHDTALQYWCQKWHGSHELMYGFARGTDPATALGATLRLEAHLEFSRSAGHDEPSSGFWVHDAAVRTDLDAAVAWARSAPPARTWQEVRDLTVVYECLGRADRDAELVELRGLLDGRVTTFPIHGQARLDELNARTGRGRRATPARRDEPDAADGMTTARAAWLDRKRNRRPTAGGSRPAPGIPQLVGETFGDPDLERAVAAAGHGDWRPAARLLAGPEDLDDRARRVGALATVVGQDPGWADDWLQARPGDASALVVRATGEIDRAWAARGSGWAESVSDEGWRLFFQRLHHADELCDAAVSADRQDLAPRLARLTLGMGLQVGHDEFRRRWADAVACHPLSRPAHYTALQYWCRKWYGSHDLMYEFARSAKAAGPGTWTATMPLRAHIEYALRVQKDGGDDTGPVDLAWFWERSPQVLADLDTALAWTRRQSPATGLLDLAQFSLTFYCLGLAERWREAREVLELMNGHATEYPFSYWGTEKELTNMAEAVLARS